VDRIIVSNQGGHEHDNEYGANDFKREHDVPL